MAETTSIQIRIHPETKERAEKLFADMGITLSDAIDLFLCKSIAAGGLPFDEKQPLYNTETEVSMQEARDILGGKVNTKTYATAGELFEELNKEMD
ncbi:type II toxin-antitoxin system RelB/DinJ family antitoxin [Diplocloster agilis]|uniref:type II toxin-antitoxin system RelB/DinJ family antitoxin n=1 Tax=Diplocloster agilis TaxID=2850323 RepID=UPI00082032E5|nr:MULTISPECIES: type II toxin-antitoxin system RelB/DinJ family antitoxin [Lachnospiraceae]MBU9745298.1 type II toxin-antitoxin system RelB/DinJ family antitoxin [Diplocloster agilis]MCU6735447.1 type II toxin-antitoxin system RelB/DinJ family antitoxin [Suonthocola fibrivorans]SCJ73980.1 Antitoxin DinJ [uncultured Clostridium sp.]